jgi:hypothetical protein
MESNSSVPALHIAKLVTAQTERLCVVHSLSSREAVVRASLALESGQSVTLGLRNGFTVPAIVGFVRDHQISLLFEEHVSMSTILAEQRNGRDERDVVRLNVNLPVSVTTRTGQHSCTMHDISQSGIKILLYGDGLEQGADVQVEIDGIGKRDAVVRWRRHPYTGLSFHIPLGFSMLDQWTVGMNG